MRRTGERAGVRGLAIAGVAVVALTGCQAQSSIVPAHESDPVVVIETASFGEAEVVGHIYGNALLRSGSRVTLRPQSGDQAEVLESVTTGDATFTIGFTGELLRAFDPGSTVVEADEVYTAMMAALPEGVTAADPAPAEDAPVYVVTRHTSETRGLRTMSDLAGRCGEFTLGARQEALADRELATAVGGTYDCGFGRRVALGPNPRAVFDALRAGEIGVGLVQSTDPVLDPDDMVPLDDDEDAILAQHVVPVFRKGSLSEDQLALVNRISGELTTEDVRELLLGVEFGTSTPTDLANYWLDSHDY
ncbi:MAG: glycine betaine ABC transporter substrate-binding protein [Dietzia sp.]|uniref:glycine betaine ABC transporter substrate-binding protein n=1 Tax=Dietzia TaxID=37914 RepID=UPI0015CE2231|nr:glycine betaine ABC transporter substrate-binding protein [Dietzia sp.]MDO8394230.1 glycine betaine ABC transporter substrate-binding protein [Dietzia sp.]